MIREISSADRVQLYLARVLDASSAQLASTIIVACQAIQRLRQLLDRTHLEVIRR